MKICFSMLGIAPNRGGVRRYAERLAEALERTRGPGDALEILDGKPRRFSLDKHLHSWSMRRRADLDLLHVPNVYAPWYRTRFAKVATVHDLTPLTLPWTHQRRNVVYHRWMLARVLAASDHVLTVSEASRRDLLRLGGLDPARVTVTYEAADARPGPQASREGDGLGEHLLSVGAREPRKNLGGVLAAYRILRSSGCRLPLMIAGPAGWKRAVPRELVQGEGVVWKGFVSDGKLADLYRKAAILLYPSFCEGFGLPVLEAMAAGTPVVASDRGALREVAADAALYADPNAPGEIAAAAGRLLSDAGLWRRMSARGRARAGEFSWEKTARQTWDVYRSVLRDREETGGRRQEAEKTGSVSRFFSPISYLLSPISFS